MINHLRIDHVVWDWNGTLLADSSALINATIEVFAQADLKPVTRERYQQNHVQPIPLFYERLAERKLSEAEQEWLAQTFQTTYVRYRQEVGLNSQALDALKRCAESGVSQSLLSMYPQDKLLPLVRDADIEVFFTRIDGLNTEESAKKYPHLAQHIQDLDANPETTLIIGDSVDDALAARDCGAHCFLYHAGQDALHARSHFEELGIPIIDSLHEAVTHILDQR